MIMGKGGLGGFKFSISTKPKVEEEAEKIYDVNSDCSEEIVDQVELDQEFKPSVQQLVENQQNIPSI
jgi:hypothetical protein